MKLLFVFTGGTIGSTQSGNIIFADSNKSYKIIDAYARRYGIDFEYDISEPYNELSENNTGRQIKMLVDCIKANENKGYDGIIATHGSDTLQYSAAAIGYALGANSLPVCLVASNAPIESEGSNALDNLCGAISFIRQNCGSGAFVIYRNSKSDTVQAHRATRLIASNAYSDEVISARGEVYGAFDGAFTFRKNPNYLEGTDEIEPLSVSALESAASQIMMISVYPGMIYPMIPDGVKYVILNTYHSGTLDTKSQSIAEFARNAKNKNVKIYATGVYDGPQYSSAAELERLNIEPIKNISPISAYVKLWLSGTLGKNPDEILQASLCGDIIK